MKGDRIYHGSGGRLVSSSDQGCRRDVAGYQARLWSLQKKRKRGSHQIQYDDESYNDSLSPLNNADWQIFTVVPLSAATEPIDRLFKEIIAAMLVCVTACIAIINWISGVSFSRWRCWTLP